QGFSQMPEPRWRKNRARGIYEDILELQPDHVPAAVQLAEILDGEDRTEEALAGLKELPEVGEMPEDPEAARAAAETRAAMERSRTLFPGLDKLMETHPDYARGWWVRSTFCQSRNWIKEAEDAAERALEANPRFTPALGYLLRAADRAGNMQRAEELCNRMVQADHGNFGIRSRLIEFAHRRGETDKALAMLDQLIKDNPSDFRVRGRRIDILASLRRYDEAITALRELADFSPLEPSYPQKIGQLLRYKGDNDGAKAAWNRALALEPGRGRLRRELARLDGGDFDFARPYMVDAEEMWRNCGDQEKYPKSVAVHLIDHQVIRVNEDGSYSSITHNAYKLLNEKGRDKYQNVYVPGTLLEVRAVSPEGEVFLPIQARGRSFTIEGIQEGWLVEWRYLEDHGRDENGFDSGGWYFQDPNFGRDGDPVLLSRLVVDMPADMKVKMQLRNYGGKPTETVAEGRRVLDFEKRDMPRIEDEPRMPSADELLPWVHFYTHSSWEDVNLSYMGDLGGFRSSPMLERKAAEITAGKTGTMERARALYDFVNEEITGNAGGWSSTGILLEKSGDRYTLFGSLLKAAGIAFDPVRVSTGDQSRKDWVKINSGLFGSRGLVIHGDAEADRTFIFRFSRHTPFGRLPLSVRGKPAFIPRPGGPEMFRMPTGDDHDVQSRADVTITLGATPADTKFNLRVEQPTEGWYGYKEQVKDTDEDNRRKNTVSIMGSHVTTPDLANYAYPGLETPGEPFVLMADGGLPYQLREEGGEMLVDIGPRPMGMSDRYVERPDREYDLVLGGTRIQRDRFTYELGSHWTVRTLPEAHIAASKIGTYSLSVRQDGSTVHVERRIRFAPCRYTPEEYSEFIAWCRGIDTAEEQKIILEKKE
ncbi:MAG: tetratricopeptide repeat protein, partial [Planctomycetota bacterium]